VGRIQRLQPLDYPVELVERSVVRRIAQGLHVPVPDRTGWKRSREPAMLTRVTRLRVGSEREVLSAFLDQQRDVIVWKLDGLTDEQLRQRIAPGGLYLLGLVKHLASVEYYWLCDVFGRASEPVSVAASDQAELDAGDTTHDVLALYARARAASGQAMSEVDLDTTGNTWLGDTVSFRWAIYHVIEETARHAGHADIIRDHIDNITGYQPGDLPY
jgi:hypothetical protein